MTTTADLVGVIADALGCSIDRPKQHIRALREAGELPTTTHRSAIPNVTNEQVVLTLLATVIDAPLKDTAAIARKYYSLGVRDDDYELPPYTLGDALVAEMESLTAGKASEFAGAIIVVAPTPAARLIYDSEHSVEAVALASPDSGVRFGPHAGLSQRQHLFYRQSLKALGKSL